ncbi:MAG: TTC39/IML2 family protein [Kangiellaceae bacterium]|nr:TTC39/IML2 family protein [Kangiellaceae bacterium]
MPNCYRCKNELKDITPQGLDTINFFSCEKCGCQYAKTNESELHDRWLMPLTLPLYEVIYEKQPLNKIDRVMNSINKKKEAFKLILAEHIESELQNPKQKISQIHQFQYPDEEKLRHFLAEILNRLTIKD